MARRIHVGFVMEQALGHVTYARNLQRALRDNRSLSATWLEVPYSSGGTLDRLPVTRSCWAARGSLRASMAVSRARQGTAFDVLFFHTQTVALLAPVVRARAPFVVSLDATPLNYDSVGRYYQHDARPGTWTERVKCAIYRQVFVRAAALTTWSQWAEDSLRDDYGVNPDCVQVIPPGVDLDLFTFGAQPRPARSDRPVRILFVGADFERKGGPLLLDCLSDGLARNCELHLVTRKPIAASERVHVYNDLGPNDPRLLALYRDADIFALPTHADCLAVVLGEAMAAGLPIVTTSVGAQPEAVQDGVSGLVVAPADAHALGRALGRLAGDVELRQAMGRRGRAIAEARFDAAKNAGRLASLIAEAADIPRGESLRAR